jgi:OFA family oxalate/formate antiporter-like MFS transporter
MEAYDYTVKEASATWQMWTLWLLLFLCVSAGIMIISQESPIAQQQAHMTPVAAGTMVGLLGIFNALGRFFWAWVSDYVGRARVYFLLYLIFAMVYFVLPRISSETSLYIALAGILLCYGGAFGVMPSFTADYFGAKHMGGIYGWILLAWGVGGVVSPLMIAHLRQSTGQYITAFHIILGVMVVSLVLPLIIRPPKGKAAAPVQAMART